MLNLSFIGKDLLTALLNQAWTLSSSSYTNPTKSTINTKLPTRVYLGFSTTTPSVSAEGAVSNFTEPTCGGSGETGAYARQELTRNGLSNSKILSAVDVVERKVGIYDNPSDVSPSGTVTKKVARIRNHDELILFPYTGQSDEEGAGYNAPITHFGIFDAATGGNLIFFGPLKESVTVGKNVVPVILKDGLEITLG